MTSTSSDKKIANLFAQGTRALDAARSVAPHERVALLDEAERRFQTVLVLDPSLAEAALNLGLVALQRAEIGPLAADVSWVHACSAFARAINLDPTMVRAHVLLGYTRAELAKHSEEPERSDLLEEAREAYRTAEAHHPGVASYNIACTYALQGDPVHAQVWMREAQRHQILPPLEAVQSDPDLDALRCEPWFQAWLASGAL